MFDGDAVGGMLGSKQTFAATKLFKHFRQTFVEVKIRPQFFEFVIGRPIHPKLIEQDLHVGELVVVAMVAYMKDRKSTRLNSSHMSISYAVFCLKKKKRHNINRSQCSVKQL